MSALALYLKEKGFEVSGYDEDTSKSRENLTRCAIKVYDKLNQGIEGADAVIYSSALSHMNRALLLARELGIPTYSRAELLGEIMLEYDVRIGVSGTHGKSTTVGILDRILNKAGLCPTVFSGAELDTGSAYRGGTTDYLLYEACEYKDAFLHFSPTYAIITNVELDHTDYFADLSSVIDSFYLSVKRAESVIISSEGFGAKELIKRLGERAITYGRTENAMYRYELAEQLSGNNRFRVYRCDEPLGCFSVCIPGEHNIENAVAAIALSTELGIPYATICEAVRTFCGVPRRLELLGMIGARSVYYDYAHHPTEIKASIDALHSHYDKVAVIFKPHTYSRTRDLWGGFVESLSLADYCVIGEVYPARESPIEGICAMNLASCIDGAVALDGIAAIKHILDNTDGAIVLMGAGALDEEKGALLELIKEKKR